VLDDRCWPRLLAHVNERAVWLAAFAQAGVADGHVLAVKVTAADVASEQPPCVGLVLRLVSGCPPYHCAVSIVASV
jgi:hypothetical protein